MTDGDDSEESLLEARSRRFGLTRQEASRLSAQPIVRDWEVRDGRRKMTYHDPRTGQEFHDLPLDPWHLELYTVGKGWLPGPAPKALRGSYRPPDVVIGKKSVRDAIRTGSRPVTQPRSATASGGDHRAGSELAGKGTDDLRSIVADVVKEILGETLRELVAARAVDERSSTIAGETHTEADEERQLQLF